MARLFIDGREYAVDEDQNLLAACLALGIDLPYFCWHPALGSVGACRQCAVTQYRDENDRKGKIVMACMTPAKDGTRISVAEPEAAEMRRAVIEWLMTNHPHDCPVCEEGGECHLQDMTVMTGHVYRRNRFPKRTFRNQDLGPFLGHEMNRCITCYRCVRFYRDYAAGKDLHALAIADHVYFGRLQDGALENPFSGNLVEVCPTGVFTDKPFSRRYTRKWDLQSAPSLCVHCAVGCNTQPGARYGELRRIMNRYNHEVNGYFICDRGRFGADFVNSDRRIRQVLARREDGLVPVPPQEAVQALTARLRTGRVLGIGSPRASLEANVLLRDLVGEERFFAGIGDAERRLDTLALQIMREGPVPAATRPDIEAADCILVLGEDLANTAPRTALSLRQATRNKAMEIAADAMVEPWKTIAVEQASGRARAPLFVLSPYATDLDDVAARTLRAPPRTIARLGFAIAHRIKDWAPDVEGLPRWQRTLVEEIADALANAERPLVVSGSGCGSPEIMEAAANVAWALDVDGRAKGRNGTRLTGISLALPECNSMGLAMLEAPPLEAAFALLEQGAADTLLILENDLYRRAPSRLVDAALGRAEQVFLLDHLHNATSEKADWLLPAATFAEGDATLVNSQGRAQRAYKVLPPEGEVRESWRWLHDLAAAGDETAKNPTFDEVTAARVARLPAFSALAEGIGEADRPAAAGAGAGIPGPVKIPRATPRYSGRTAMDAHRQIRELPPPRDPDSPFTFSMEGSGAVPAGLAPWYWTPGWNSNEALNRFQQEIPGPLRDARPGVPVVEPAQGAPLFFGEPPAPFRRRRNRWLFLPLHHCLGSEELSARAEAVARRAPAPYLGLGREDAERLGLVEGQSAEVRLAGQVWRLPVRLSPEMANGIAGLPVGLAEPTGAELGGAELPAWGEIRASDRGDTNVPG
jgi:NADH-quinone oxidoreductase subunit G